MIDFQENDDPGLIELMKQREVEQKASKNLGVVDPDEYRKRLEAIDAEHTAELNKDIRYKLALVAYGHAQDVLVNKAKSEQVLGPRVST